MINDEVVSTARTVMDTLMRDHGVTEVQLAPVLGVSQPCVSDRRTGKTPLTLADVRRLALFFGVSPMVFFEGVSSPSASSNSAIAA